jgi:putative addiction module CopG family antidote
LTEPEVAGKVEVGDVSMTIHLSSDQLSFVQNLVSTGAYESEASVINAALELLKSQKRDEHLRGLLEPAIQEIERGEGIVLETEEDIDAFFAEILGDDHK